MSQLQELNERAMLGREGTRQLMQRVRQALQQKSNPNLLHNWDFRRPVNRSGQGEYTGIGYTIDRWGASDNIRVTLEADGIIIENTSDTSGGEFNTFLEANTIPWGTYTLSLLVQDITSRADFRIRRTDTWAELGSISAANAGLYSVTFDTAYNGRLSVGFYVWPKQLLKVSAVKLELGSTQTLARQNADGECEIIDPPDYDLQYLLCSQYSPITGEWVGSQHSNPNLLDNWYFVDPINQRGQTEYTAVGYTIDRWKTPMNTLSVSVKNGFLELGATSEYQELCQPIENAKMLSGNQITFSMLYKSKYHIRVYALSSSPALEFMDAEANPSEDWTAFSVTATVPDADFATGALRFNIAPRKNGNITAIKAVKLELGPVQTLAHKEGDIWVLNDPPPNKGLELLKCQRYFERVYFAPFDTLIGTWTDRISARYSYKVTKRIIPTIIGQPQYVCRIGYNDGVFGAQVYKMPTFNAGIDSCEMAFSDTQVATVGIGHFAYIGNTVNTYFDVSADL